MTGPEIVAAVVVCLALLTMIFWLTRKGGLDE